MPDSSGRMTLRGIEIFSAVVELGSISAAAKQLEASPSSVSQQITNLEAAVGTRLIDRAARPVSLTPGGGIFLRRARVILEESRQAQAELALLDLSQLTRLRLGMIEDFDADVTPKLLSDMAEELKGCHFVLETGSSYHLAAMLEGRALDVIVAADLDMPAEGMEVYPLLSDPFLVAAPKGAVNPSQDVLPQLLKLPFIRYSSRQMMGRQIDAHLTRLGLKLPNRFELDSYHAIMAMVESGAGWTMTTPLGYTRARRFKDKVDVMALPFEPLVRHISLFARKGSMDSMPKDIASRLRPLLQGFVVDPSLTDLPWLKGGLQVL